MKIVEYIGKEGVVSSDRDSLRMATPEAGDVIIWDIQEYPLNVDTYGRIEAINYLDTGKIHICCEPGSVYWNKKGSVSISGGPFLAVLPEVLEPTYTIQLVKFWNFGDNSWGAGQAVDYFVHRPVFKIKQKH